MMPRDTAKESTVKDRDIQQIVGNLLRYGIWISLGVTCLGGIIYIIRHSQEPVDYSQFTENRHDMYSLISAAIDGALQFRGRAIILLGILLLFLTPILRVLFSLVAFLLEKDYLYVAITLIVISIICYSVTFGFSH